MLDQRALFCIEEATKKSRLNALTTPVLGSKKESLPWQFAIATICLAEPRLTRK